MYVCFSRCSAIFKISSSFGVSIERMNLLAFAPSVFAMDVAAALEKR